MLRESLLRSLFVACPISSMKTIEGLSDVISRELNISPLDNASSRQALLSLAIVAGDEENTGLARELIARGGPPNRNIFNIAGSSMALPPDDGLSLTELDPAQVKPSPSLGIWAALVKHRWVAADKCLAFYAVRGGSPEAAIELLDALSAAGVDWRQHGISETLAEAAAQGGQPLVLKHVIDRAFPTSCPTSLMSWAARRKVGGITMMEFISGQPGAHVDAQGPAPRSPQSAEGGGSTTALMEAARHGNLEAVRWLLSKGASPDVTDDQGKKPYDIALENGHIEIAKHLNVPFHLSS